jgi:hypothetical protein
MGGTLKYYDDGEWVPVGQPPAAYSSMVVKGAVTGLVNGSNTVFVTSQAYIAGTLQVYVNGLAQSGLVTETTPTDGTFTLDTAPLTGDDIKVYFHTAAVAIGNAASVGGYDVNAILGAIFPVGAVFVSGSSTLPALISGLGTWVRLDGRVIVGVDTTQTEFDTVNETGGAKTHTLLTTEIPAHSHTVPLYGTGVGGSNPSTGPGGFAGINYPTANAGGGGAHNNLQPYKTKFMWERTA